MEYKLGLTRRWEYHSRSEAMWPVKSEIKPKPKSINPQTNDHEIDFIWNDIVAVDLQHTCLFVLLLLIAFPFWFCNRARLLADIKLNLQALATPITQLLEMPFRNVAGDGGGVGDQSLTEKRDSSVNNVNAEARSWGGNPNLRCVTRESCKMWEGKSRDRERESESEGVEEHEWSSFCLPFPFWFS